MLICPGCGKTSPEGINFCEACGTKLVAEPVQQEPVAQQVEAAPVFPEEPAVFQQEPFDAPAEEPKPRKKVRKGLIWILAGAGALLAVAAVLVYLFVFKGSKLPAFALYVKDDQLVYSKFTDETTFDLTDKLLTDDLELEDIKRFKGSSYISYIQTDKNGKRVFFPDRFSEDNVSESGYVQTFNLYYRDVTKADSAPVKVDSEVEYYLINATGTKVLYSKDYNLYIHDLEDKEKIASHVRTLYPSADLSKVVYTVADEKYKQTLYIWEDGESRRLTDDIQNVGYVTADCSVAYYTKENDSGLVLYKFLIGEDKSEKIDSDIYGISAVYDSGEVYYTKATEVVSDPMSKWVTDDMASSDANMKEPEYPYSSDYSTYSAYESALEYYQSVLLPAWEEKEDRDYLRERIEEEDLEISTYTLCYYNGEDSKEIADVKSGYIRASAAEKPIVAVSLLKEMDLQPVKLSEISSVWDVESAVANASAEAALVIGSKLVSLKHEDAGYIQFNEEGSAVYYMTDCSEEAETGDLYKASVSDDGVGKAERVDTDVACDWCYILENGSAVYFKDLVEVEPEDTNDDDGWVYSGTSTKCDLYIDGKKVDSDVWTDEGFYIQEDSLIYVMDWDTKEKTGTLKRYKDGKKAKIADDVYEFDVLPNDDILYLTDYDLEDQQGELYYHSGKKAEKLDSDVCEIIVPYIVTEEFYQEFYQALNYALYR